MTALPADLGALLALAFVLGARHGVDADHLAAIDALARVNRARGRAGWCFAAGHGLVVGAVALAVAAAQAHAAMPGWLQPLGAWTSVVLLLLLGVLNLRALRLGSVALPVGLRSRWLGAAVRPGGAVLAGALFALSFDTLALAALFGGSGHPLAAAGAFVAGMALVDGLNGWCVARLLQRADARAARVARALGWAIVALSLGLATWAVAQLVQPAVPPLPALALATAVLAASVALGCLPAPAAATCASAPRAP